MLKRFGMNSAWIGEHHFSSLGVLSCPDLELAFIGAFTEHIRLAPALTLPHELVPISNICVPTNRIPPTADLKSGRRLEMRLVGSFSQQLKGDRIGFATGTEFVLTMPRHPGS
jgi:hypothetical protein